MLRIKQIVVYVLSIISLVFLFALWVIQLISFRIEVPTGSMLNTIQLHQQLIVKKDKWIKQYSRGDIVVFKQDGNLLIKRLIGLPGEVIRITDGTVYVDGKLLFEDYLSSNTSDYDGTFFIPEDSYLFLGDNRADSFDARRWENPFVIRDDILGKAICYAYPKFELISEVIYATN